jgi:hypothetical protein
MQMDAVNCKKREAFVLCDLLLHSWDVRVDFSLPVLDEC